MGMIVIHVFHGAAIGSRTPPSEQLVDGILSELGRQRGTIQPS